MEILASLMLSGSTINNKINNETEVSKIKNLNKVDKINRIGPNIYNSRSFREEFAELHAKADERYKLSHSYKETGIIPNYVNKLNYLENRGVIVRGKDDVEYETTGDTLYSQRRERYDVTGIPKRIVKGGRVIYMQTGGGLKSILKQKDKPANKKDKPKNKKDSNQKQKGGKHVAIEMENSNDSEFTESEFSKDMKSIDSAVGKNHVELFNRTLGFNNNNRKSDHILKKREKSYHDQFDEMRFGMDTEDPRALNNMSDTFRDGFSSYQTGGKNDMTYGVVESKTMTHNNMLPSFKSHGAGYGPNAEIDQQMNYFKNRKVELFSGSANNLDYRPKRERKQLFNPLVGLSHMNGMPNFTDYQEQYYIPSRYRNNEKPFQEVRVTPGLNLGYNEVSKQGIGGDPYRAFRPTVDELRVASNPKTSYGPFPNIVNNQNPENRPYTPNVKKRKPVTFWEMDRPINGMGEIRAPKIEGEFYLPATARQQTTTEWKGPAKLAQIENLPLPEDMIAKMKPASRQNFNLNRSGGGAGNQQFEKQQAFDMVTNVPDATNRSIFNKTDRTGQIGNAQFSKSHAFDMFSNIPAQTMRNMHGGYDRVGAAVGNSQHAKSHAFDMATGVPDANMRNIHNVSDRAGASVGNNQYAKSHAFDMFSNIPSATMRDLHNKPDRMGTGIARKEHEKGYAFDQYANTPAPTLRDIHSKNDRSGQIGNSQLGKHQAFDFFTNIPDATLRDIANRFDRMGTGAVGVSELGKGYAFDHFSNTPAPTMRNLHSNTERSGFVGNSQHGKGHAFDFFSNTPAATLRDIHNKTERSGQVGNSQHAKGHAFDMFSNIPQATMRDLSNKTDRAGAGVGNSQFNKSVAFDMDTNRPEFTMRDVHSKLDRAGHAVGNSQFSKGQAFDEFNARPDATMKDMTINNERAGHGVGNAQFQKPQAFDEFTARPDATMKDMTINNDRAGNALGNNQFHKPQAFDYFSSIPDPTLRQMTENNTWLPAPQRTEKLKQMGRGDMNAALLNIVKEKIARGREPTKCNYTKGPTFEHTIVQLCNPLQVNRELYPDIKEDPRTRPPTNLTRHGNILPQNSWRFYSHVDDNIKDNPFINNMVHQAGVNA